MNDDILARPVVASLRGLQAHYPIRHDAWGRPREWLRAVDSVDLEIHQGETLGLVGESGCGKSTLARTLLGLRPATGGSVRVLGQDLAHLDRAGMKALRRRMQIVFQDPYASLDPRATVGMSIRAGLDLHGIGTPADRPQRVAALLQQVGLAPEVATRWPHEFSGGQRQRIGIARALAVEPELLVCDEPVSALDVSIQAQILNLLKSLQQRMRLTMLFVSHNLAVVEHMADRVAVMYRGRIVEQGPCEAVFRAPRHPYTRLLMATVPVPDPRQRLPAAGMQPAEGPAPPGGCAFAPRCAQASEACAQSAPVLRDVAPLHRVACLAVARD